MRSRSESSQLIFDGVVWHSCMWRLGLGCRTVLFYLYDLSCFFARLNQMEYTAG